MAFYSGIGAQLGIAAESVYGTFVAPTRFLPFTSESLKLEEQRNETKSLRSGQRIQRSDQWAAGRNNPAGGLEFEIGNKGFGLLFKHMLGAVATTADGAGYRHRCTIGSLYGLGLSAQVGRPAVNGDVVPFSYIGTKISGWEIEQAFGGDGFPTLKLDTVATSESQDEDLGAASAPAETEVFHFTGMTLAISGYVPGAVDSFSVKGVTPLATERYGPGSRDRREPLENKRREISGEIVGEFENGTTWRGLTGSHGAITATWVTVATYDTAKPYKLVVSLPCVRFDWDGPNVVDDVTPQTLPFKVVDDGVNAPITIDYYTSEASP